MIGPGVPITIPRVAQPVAYHSPDYEVELTVVIGKAAKDVPESEALDYVLGYTVGNDVRKHTLYISYTDSRTSRSPLGTTKWLQGAYPGFRVVGVDDVSYSQWSWSKSFDDTTPFGPVLVSAKAIPDPQTLSLRAEVNGKILQNGTTAYEIIDFTCGVT